MDLGKHLKKTFNRIKINKSLVEESQERLLEHYSIDEIEDVINQYGQDILLFMRPKMPFYKQVDYYITGLIYKKNEYHGDNKKHIVEKINNINETKNKHNKVRKIKETKVENKYIPCGILNKVEGKQVKRKETWLDAFNNYIEKSGSKSVQ